ncbi:MAG TPA: ROK family transcriptional regulator [Gaiellaceae bacterium]|nr:ROK family transcriptional regulator [Gaiellaceae bacterium]
MGSLRERNRALVVDTLRRRGSASRSDLARLTGLSRTTVGSVVAGLRDQGLVVEQELEAEGQSGPGRPPVLLRLDPAAGVAMGVNFDHDGIRVAFGDLSSTVLGEDHRAIDVDHSAAEAIDLAVRMSRALQREIGVLDSQLVAAGVALPGPIDRRTGRIGSEVILPGWAGVQAQHALSERFGLHVEVDNDANLGALAEATLGAARGLANVIYAMVGSGIGAGLVLDGRVHRGGAGLAGEIGHVQVRADGAVCRCGNRGCLETVAGEGALRALLRPRVGRDVTTEDLVQLVADGDLGARRVVNDAGRAIGRVLADLCNALNPEAIVVGGSLGPVGEPLVSGIRESVDRYALPAAAEGVRVVPGDLGERAEVIGALALVAGDTESLSSGRLPAFARVPETQAGRSAREEVRAGST